MVVRLLLLLLMGNFSLAYAAPTATVDRTSMNEGESLRLIIEGGDDEPELGPLEALFNVHGTSTSSQVSFVNGRMSSSKQWIVTLTPKQSGRIIIPAIKVGNEKTQPLEIVVRKAGSQINTPSGSNLFIEVSAQPKQPYVQSQVVYTVKLYHAADIRDGGLSQPKMDDVVIERLGNDKTYQTTVKGQRYQVTERRYALFPQSSGTIKIPPTVFSGQVIDMRGRFQNRNADPFNRFFSQPTTRPVQLRSKEISLKVRARPSAAKGTVWLPASKLDLTESWSQNLKNIKVGEPITRTVRVEAHGLTGAQLPEMLIAEHPAFKQYPDQPKVENVSDGESLIGVREDKIAIVPNQEGTITLPEIRLQWWNTRKNRQEVAVIPARNLNVQPAAVSASPNIPSITSSQQDLLPGNINELNTLSSQAPQQSALWMWVSIVALLGWLFTGLAWWRSPRSASSKMQEPADKPLGQGLNLAADREAIKRACIANNPAQARQALINWGRQVWPNAGVSSLLGLSECVGSGSKQLFRHLDSAIYSSSPGHWDGHAFWDNCSPLLKSPKIEQKSNQSLLPELYPQR